MNSEFSPLMACEPHSTGQDSHDSRDHSLIQRRVCEGHPGVAMVWVALTFLCEAPLIFSPNQQYDLYDLGYLPTRRPIALNLAPRRPSSEVSRRRKIQTPS